MLVIREKNLCIKVEVEMCYCLELYVLKVIDYDIKLFLLSIYIYKCI